MAIPGESRRVYLLLGLALGLAACGGGGGDGDDVAVDPDAAAGDPDAAVAIDAPVTIDAPVAIDAPPAENFAMYRIDIGRHDATIIGGDSTNPIRQLVTVNGRDFRFAFNASAMYTITNPVEPQDQLDWNKLPGLSDCGTVDLSVNGAMFGWRWRLDLTPRVLEVTSYANNNSTHLWPAQPLFTLTAAEVMADAPLRYRVWSDGSMYRFSVQGAIGARVIDVSTTMTRACTSNPAFRWAGQFYFGGTSTAPSVITSRVHEVAFAP